MEIGEGTVARMEGHRIAVGNIWQRDFLLPDGHATNGPAATLYVTNNDATGDASQEIVAGEGSIVEIGASRWIVTCCEQGPLNRGRICLDRLKT
jgi:hypothetical protein